MLSSTHPTFDEKKDEWIEMRDSYKGERAVKQKRETYLPATKSMKLDGMGIAANGTKKLGQEQYDAYLTRAVFPEYVKDAVEAFIGLLHQKPPTIELPAVMEPLRKSATMYGEPLELLMRRINEEQLVTGRLGILLDLPVNPDPTKPMPYIALYIAESIRNWDDGEILEGQSRLNLVVLDESGYKRVSNGFIWQPVAKYRVLQLGQLVPDEPDGTAVYSVGVFTNEGGIAPAFDPTQMKSPQIRGNVLEEIPFVFVNTKDIVPVPDEPPLATLMRACMTIYRGEADYRQNLFMQGQDTLVLIGERRKIATEDPATENQPLRTGAGSLIEMETGGDAKYVGVESQGLAEQRSALEADRKRAENKAGTLVDATSSGDKESGVALQTRVAAQTATLNQIALTGAAALEKILKICAVWMGANPDEVTVTPNLEFADIEMDGDTLLKLMTAKNMGAPLSLESIHVLMAEKGMTKMDFKTELSVIDTEKPLISMPTGTGTTAGGPPADKKPADKLGA